MRTGLQVLVPLLAIVGCCGCVMGWLQQHPLNDQSIIAVSQCVLVYVQPICLACPAQADH